MKCLYAISAESAREAHALCEAYGASLEALSSNTVALADDLRAFAESTGAAVLKLDDEDWVVAQQGLEGHGAGALAGHLYWSKDSARRAQEALDGSSDATSSARALASWLANQVRRDRAVVSSRHVREALLTLRRRLRPRATEELLQAMARRPTPSFRSIRRTTHRSAPHRSPMVERVAPPSASSVTMRAAAPSRARQHAAQPERGVCRFPIARRSARAPSLFRRPHAAFRRSSASTVRTSAHGVAIALRARSPRPGPKRPSGVSENRIRSTRTERAATEQRRRARALRQTPTISVASPISAHTKQTAWAAFVTIATQAAALVRPRTSAGHAHRFHPRHVLRHHPTSAPPARARAHRARMESAERLLRRPSHVLQAIGREARHLVSRIGERDTWNASPSSSC